MRIAITGSSGLIGTALRERLSTAGHDVVRLVRSASSEPGTIQWDPRAGTIDAAGLEGVDAVVHLAGAGIGDQRWTDERKAEIRDSRTLGTSLLARTLAGLDRKPSVFISGSAVGWYADTGSTAVDESGAPGADFPASVAHDWEAAAAPAVDAGIRTVFIRTGIVLSPEGGALKKQLPIFKLGAGGRFGSGDQYQPWISIDDEIGAIEWLLDADVEGPVNLTAPEPVTNAAFTKALGRVLHRPTFIVPMLGPRLLLGRELADSLLLTSLRVLPGKLEAGGYRFAHPDLDGALHHLLD